MEPESELKPPLWCSSGYSQQTWLQLRLQPTNVAPAFDRFPSAFAAGYIGKIKLFSSQIIFSSRIPNIFLVSHVLGILKIPPLISVPSTHVHAHFPRLFIMNYDSRIEIQERWRRPTEVQDPWPRGQNTRDLSGDFLMSIYCILFTTYMYIGLYPRKAALQPSGAYLMSHHTSQNHTDLTGQGSLCNTATIFV